MDVRELYDHWGKRPFEPFTLAMSNRERFDDHLSKVLLVTKSAIAYGIADPKTYDGIVDRIISLSPDEVVRIELL